tara:strand:- start:5686 stop:7272 length:1587 start_codon:yes stop_codon:yes gene_type:complete
MIFKLLPKKYKENLIISILPLFFVATFIGPFMENLYLVLLSLISIIYMINSKYELDYLKKKYLLISVFFFSLIFSSSFSFEILYFLKSITYFLYLFLIIVSLHIDFPTSKIKNLILVSLIPILVLIFDLIFQKIFLFNILGFEAQKCFKNNIFVDNCRLSSFFVDEIVSGSFLSKFSIIFLLYYIVFKKYLITYFLFTISILVIYFTQERMSLIYIVQIFMIFIFFSTVQLQKKNLRFTIYFITILSTLLLGLYLKQSSNERFNEIFKFIYSYDYHTLNLSDDPLYLISDFEITDQIIFNEKLQLDNKLLFGFYTNKDKKNKQLKFQKHNFYDPKYSETTYRLTTNSIKFLKMDKNKIYKQQYDDEINIFEEIQMISIDKIPKNIFDTGWGAHFLAALNLIKLKPLLGGGVDSFQNNCKTLLDDLNILSNDVKCTNHPHNYFLEILVSSGFISIALFILGIFYIFNNLLKKSNISNTDKMILIFAILVIINPIQITGSIFGSSFANKFWIQIIILIFFLKNYKVIDNK